MGDTKKCAPGRQATGRNREKESSAQPLASMSAILLASQPLPHIRTAWATRTELAVALGVHVDTVDRRLRRAGVSSRLVVTPQNRCRREFDVAQVRQLLEGQP